MTLCAQDTSGPFDRRLTALLRRLCRDGAIDHQTGPLLETVVTADRMRLQPFEEQPQQHENVISLAGRATSCFGRGSCWITASCPASAV